MNVVSLLAPFFESYITIHGIRAGCSYVYKKHEVQNGAVLDITMHRPKVSADEWLYVVTPASAQLEKLDSSSKLYVGSQKGDRMFRGKRSDGEAINFHHREMRRGNGAANLINHLRSRGELRVHIIDKSNLIRATQALQELSRLRKLVNEPIIPKAHAGTRFESAILHFERGQWVWNSQGAHSGVVQFLRNQGMTE